MKFVLYSLCAIAILSMVWFLDFVTPENAFAHLGFGSYILRMIGLFATFNKIYNTIYSNNIKE